MKPSKLSGWSITVSLLCFLCAPAEVSAWCREMGGYSSFEAQARAQAAQRTAAGEAQIRARETAAARIRQVSQQIKADQWILKANGFYKGDVDGRASSAFEASIADFRKAHGLNTGTTFDAASRAVLTGDTVVTKATWEARSKAPAPSTDAAAPQVATQTSTTTQGRSPTATVSRMEASPPRPANQTMDSQGRTATATAPGVPAGGPQLGAQTWTNIDGRSIQATMLSRDASSVVLRCADGRDYTVPISKLSAATQSMIQTPAGQSRTWTNIDGRSIQATMLSRDASSVVLRCADGRDYTVPISKLSAATQSMIQTLAISG
jgi:hypothetical protein